MSFHGSFILVSVLASIVRCALVPTNFSGYVIDYYCYAIVDNGGVALDGSNVITNPEAHILHCLRDVPNCRAGFFLAGESGGEYRIKFKLDKASHESLVALMDTFPVGGDRDYKAFGVTAMGMHDGDGILRDATFQTCFQEVGCDSVCSVASGTCDTPVNPDFVQSPGILLIMHVICMCLSWGFLLPVGVVWTRNLTRSYWSPGKTPKYLKGGYLLLLQSIGVLLQMLGFVCIFLWKRAAHFQLPHEIIGLTVVTLGTLQPFTASLRHLRCVTRKDGTRTCLWIVWEVVHKGGGYVATLGGLVNVIFGPIHANNLRFSKLLVIPAATWVGLCVVSVITLGVAVERRRWLIGQSKKTNEQSAVLPEAYGASNLDGPSFEPGME